jgi:hypothetical protein
MRGRLSARSQAVTVPLHNLVLEHHVQTLAVLDEVPAGLYE